jgi:hypothetical protein
MQTPTRPTFVSKLRKPRIAGGEVKLLVVERVVRDVHLAVQPELRAVGVEDGRRVVIESSRPASRTASRR